MTLRIAQIDRGEHLSYVNSLDSASFLQTPAWGDVKSEWECESLGWFADHQLVGAGLLLLRKIPKLPKWFGYLPEGPLLNWQGSL